MLYIYIYLFIYLFWLYNCVCLWYGCSRWFWSISHGQINSNILDLHVYTGNIGKHRLSLPDVSLLLCYNRLQDRSVFFVHQVGIGPDLAQWCAESGGWYQVALVCVRYHHFITFHDIFCAWPTHFPEGGCSIQQTVPKRILTSDVWKCKEHEPLLRHPKTEPPFYSSSHSEETSEKGIHKSTSGNHPSLLNCFKLFFSVALLLRYSSGRLWLGRVQVVPYSFAPHHKSSHGRNFEVGGGKDGGIMVREGCSLKSPEPLGFGIVNIYLLYIDDDWL